MASRHRYSKDGTLLHWCDGTPNSIVSTFSQADIEDLDGTEESPGWAKETYFQKYYLLQLPGIFKIEKLGYTTKATFSTTNAPIDIYVSGDSVTGSRTDGTWTRLVYHATGGGVSGTHREAYLGVADWLIAEGTIDVKWISIMMSCGGGSRVQLQNISLFGAYTNPPKFEFWDATDTVNFTATGGAAPAYPLSMPNAPNNVDYIQTKTFHLKNTDSVQHSYSISITPIENDTMVNNYFNVSVDGGTPAKTVTYENLQSGATVPITIHANIPSVNNTGNGKHYYSVNVTEIA